MNFLLASCNVYGPCMSLCKHNIHEVLGDVLFLDHLDQDISELLDSLGWYMAASDAPAHDVP